MSRSYKHTPYCGGRDGFAKKQANRCFRRKKMTTGLQHKQYRKDYCSWEIIDYFDMESFESFCKYWHRSYEDWGRYYGPYSQNHKDGSIPLKKAMYKYWYKAYKMK